VNILQPLVVSNSDLGLKISPFGSRDIVGHVAVRLTIQGFLYRQTIITVRLSSTVMKI